MVMESERFRYFPVPGGGFFDPKDFEDGDAPEGIIECYESYTWEGYHEYRAGLGPDEGASEDAYFANRLARFVSDLGQRTLAAFGMAVKPSVDEQMEALERAYGRGVIEDAANDLVAEIDRVFDPVTPEHTVLALNRVLWDTVGRPSDRSPWGENPDPKGVPSLIERFMAGLKDQWMVWKHTKHYDSSHRFSSFLNWVGLETPPILKLHMLQYLNAYA
jgi:hypothetical protein